MSKSIQTQNIVSVTLVRIISRVELFLKLWNLFIARQCQIKHDWYQGHAPILTQIFALFFTSNTVLCLFRYCLVIDFEEEKCGVPQESILCPMLQYSFFTLYKNGYILDIITVLELNIFTKQYKTPSRPS